MQSKPCNLNLYRLDCVNNDFSCQLLQHNGYSCSSLGKGCKQTCIRWFETVLKFSRGDCKQFWDAETCAPNFMGGQCRKQHRNAIYCTQTSDTVTCGDKSVWCSSSNSYRSNLIASAPSTASQGLATQISTVQRKDNSHTWCE